MARKKKKPSGVTLILRRLYGDRSRTLADTILSLIPSSPPATCHCKSIGCLSCCESPLDFLLRHEDPASYKKLLTKCFVVLSEDAPPVSDYYYHCRWSQREIVKRTAEIVKNNRQSKFNVLCDDDNRIQCFRILERAIQSSKFLTISVLRDYLSIRGLDFMALFGITPSKLNENALYYDDYRSTLIATNGFLQHHCSSTSLQLLTCSAWRLLLRRVGDEIMVYLLKHTSIFLPSLRNNYNQVAGFPISEKCFRSFRKAKPKTLKSALVLGLCGRKRMRVDEVDLDGPSSSFGCIACNSVSCSSSCSRNNRKKRHRKSLLGEATSNTRNACAKDEKFANENYKESSNEAKTKPLKRRREFMTHRQKKHRRYNIETNSSHNQSERSIKSGPISYRSVQSDLYSSSSSQCSCCLMLQTLLPVPRDSRIDKRSIFYNVDQSPSVFARKRIPLQIKMEDCLQPYHASDLLNMLKPNISGASALMKDIFGLSISQPCFHSTNCCCINSKCLYHSIIKLLKILINNVKRCDHQRLLEKHCPIPSFDPNVESECSDIQQNSLGKQFLPTQLYCPKEQVVSFIWAVCRSIIPLDLLGTYSNWRSLTRNISRFVHLRRFENFSLRLCMHKVKESMFPFLLDGHSVCSLNDAISKWTKVRHNILVKWILWFFTKVVVPLLQAKFYITESEHGKHDVFYYRKPIWGIVMDNTAMHFRDQNYLPLNEASLRETLRKRSFGFSKARLLPKGNGVRVLANLKSTSSIPSPDNFTNYDVFKSVNEVLLDLHAVLKGIQLKKPGKLGSSVFSNNDVYKKLCPFLSALKKGLPSMPPVFIVIADVRKAFDSVNQDKLLEIMNGVIQNDQYLLKKSKLVTFRKKSMWVSQNLFLADQDIGWQSTALNSSLSKHSSEGILVTQGGRRSIRKKELQLILQEHVKHNILQLDRNYYSQAVGIPQGSILSSLLCSFYYGHMEKNVLLPFIQRATAGDVSCPKSMLLRLIDDFLFVSTSKDDAISFIKTVTRGFPRYNCHMNVMKFGVNFDNDQIAGIGNNQVCIGDDGISFLRWGGLFINCCNLEIQADYTRYLNTQLSSTLTICWGDKPIKNLESKLCMYLRPKCHPIFYDSNINSPVVVRLNIYQSFLLCAMKFHCYLCDLSILCRLGADSCMDMIERSFRYMHRIMKKRMHSIRSDSTLHPIFQVTRFETKWLGLVAYIRVLKRKQARYKELLQLLRSKLIAHQKVTHVSSILKDAVDDMHSSVMWKIKY